MRLFVFALLVGTVGCSSSSSRTKPTGSGSATGGSAGAAGGVTGDSGGGTGGSGGAAVDSGLDAGGTAGASGADAGSPCSPPADMSRLLLHTSLDSQADVESPLFGPAGTLIGVPGFHSGFCGSALGPSKGNYASYPDSVIALDRGSLQFYFKANFSWKALGGHFFIRRFNGNGTEQFRVLTQTAVAQLEVRIIDAQDSTNALVLHAPTSSFPTIGNWIHFKINWDFAAANRIQLFVDGQLQAGTISGKLTAAPDPGLPGSVQIGSGSSLLVTDGLLDDLRIFDQPQ